MSEPKPEYITQSDSAEEIAGAGYEVHLPAKILEMQGDYSLKKTKSKAWVKLDTGFRGVMNALKGAKLSVFIAISLRIDENGESYPSFETISNDTGYSVRAVKYAVKSLTKSGFLTIVDGDKASNMYHVNAFAAYGDGKLDSAKIAQCAKTDTQVCKNRHKTMSEIAHKEEPIKKNQLTSPDGEKRILGIEAAIWGDRPVTEEDIAFSRGDTLESRLAGWRNAGGVTDTDVISLQAFCEAFDILPPKTKPGKKQSSIWYAWLHGIRNVRDAADGKDVVDAIKTVRASLSDSDLQFYTSPQSLIKKIHALSARVQKPQLTPAAHKPFPFDD